MRGTQHRYHIAVVIRGIIPTCTGNTSLSVRVVSVRRDHPRMCGEHSCQIKPMSGSRGSSPHVRGARSTSRTYRPKVGIIPACAGSTLGLRVLRLPAWDHPRMCGEHLEMHEIVFMEKESSPHVRGAHLVAIGQCPDLGIIPACAGSTSGTSCAVFVLGDHPRMCGEHSPPV